jgi:hypothetical protein
MKTPINLDDYDFGKRQLLQQITDDPNTGFARVIVNERVSILDDIQQIELLSKTYYINLSTQKIVPQMTHETLSKGQRWLVSNEYSVVLTDAKGSPIANLDYDENQEESESNFPYLKQRAYDRFAEFLFSDTNPLPLPIIWKMSILLDDSKGYFDIKENYA